MPVDDLIIYLNKLCTFDIPKRVETIEDMQQASNILGRIGPIYAWLINMEMRANINKRRLKKDNKEDYEKALIQEAVFSAFGKQVNIIYNTVSRMVTIKQQINQELRMLGNVT